MLLNKYKFKTKPMQHQLVGLGGMMAQFENRSPEYALFMEMGCGKTKVLQGVVLAVFDLPLQHCVGIARYYYQFLA